MTGRAQADPGEVTVDFSGNGHIATLTVSRPSKLNALTPGLLVSIIEACETINSSSARVVLLRTAGTRVFCVGADINLFADLSSIDMWRNWVSLGHRAFAAIAALRQPSIAVVDGIAYGGGFELALAADFRVLLITAGVCLPETRLGTVPGWGGTERLARLVGPHRALEMVLTRRVVTGQTALDWGIATRLAEPADLESVVDALTRELLGGAPIAVQLSKQLIDAASRGAPSSVLEALAAGVAAASDDLTEGVAAFREKRSPVFTDR